MTDWTDPRYADLVAAWESTQTPDSRDPEQPRPVRAFIAPPADAPQE
ncbi:hypothetical protein [Streptomyces sp. NPDC053728]